MSRYESLECNIRKATRLTTECRLGIVLCLTQKMQRTAAKNPGAFMAEQMAQLVDRM